MSEIITTLHEKGNPSNEVYPNIKAGNIPNNAITSAKIYNNAITNEKINDGAISTSKIQDGAISTSKIQDGSITDTKIANGLLNRCIYVFEHTSLNFTFYVEMYSKYNTTNIDAIFQELFRQIGDDVIVPCCHVSKGSLSRLGSPYGYFNGAYNLIEFTDDNLETFNVDINTNITLTNYKITSLF